MGQELELVRAYLELMQMRMPDRLQFASRPAPPHGCAARR
jgi:LytS/YehU family sensor histidine kinase